MSSASLLFILALSSSLSLASADKARDYIIYMYDESVKFLSDPPIWGIVVIIVTGLILISSFSVLVYNCCLKGKPAQERSSLEKASNNGDIESTGETDDSIEITTQHIPEDEKYVPSSVRRSFKLDETNDGISAPEYHLSPSKHGSLASKASNHSMSGYPLASSPRTGSRPQSQISQTHVSVHSTGNISHKSQGTQVTSNEPSSPRKSKGNGSVRYV